MMLQPMPVVVTAILCVQAAALMPQARPNLSGRWIIEEPVRGVFSPLGSAVTIDQTRERLTLDVSAYMPAAESGNAARSTPDDPPTRLVYNIGDETRRQYPVPPHRTPGVVISGPIGPEVFPVSDVLRRVSRTAWMGDQLLIVTHTIRRVTYPGRPPREFECEDTERLVLMLESANKLVLESQIWQDPTPYGSAGRESWPTTWTASYRRVTSRSPDASSR
jgi:hypothetical protein